MRRLPIRFTIGQIMATVAVCAVTIALISSTLPAPLAVALSIVLFAFALLTWVISGSTLASWMSVAAWLSCTYPGLIVASLYATWLTAWAVLGHRPLPSLDDPKLIGPIVDIPLFLTWALIYGVFPALVISIALIFVVVGQTALWGRPTPARTLSLMVVAILSWTSTFVLLRADPGGVLYWFMD